MGNRRPVNHAKEACAGMMEKFAFRELPPRGRGIQAAEGEYMGFFIREGQQVELHYGSREPEGVKIAIHNLARDLGKVLPGVETVLREEGPGDSFGTGKSAAAVIVIRTLEPERGVEKPAAGQADAGSSGRKQSSMGAASAEPHSIWAEGAGGQETQREDVETQWEDAETLQKGTEPQREDAEPQREGTEPQQKGTETQRKDAETLREGTEQGVDRSLPADENGMLRKEAYQLRVQDGTLYITGTDRRGTIYGIYTFCQWMGVSPWYFFADVPVKKRRELALEEGYCLADWPSVEYRGIFINDEEELEAWVQNHMEEPTIGVKTYEKIFELLLRLKANYIWPAMHVNSFNLVPENGALADRMGIVVGTSHCDMLMRSNNREWKPWIKKKGYADAVYDYSIEGENRDILKEYWRESVEQNRDFEVCYTLGMRGIHDSGFETKNLEGGTEEEIRTAKIELLGKIIADQREILRDTLGHDTMMTFIPYKEVMDLYDNGLEIPEDMTLVWANDNYGHIRRYPSGKEKNRKGGNGIYYHNSYWAPPSMSYVFLCSIPLAHTGHELQKAWNEGIRKLWVLNCGSMKPLEQEITFFLRLAWEIGKPGALTEDVEAFVEDWIDHTFTGNIGRQVSVLLNDFSQLTNVRKPENIDYDAFSQTAYGDEAAMRIHRYEGLFAQGNALYEKLPEEERDAFFQLVLMRIHAAYFTGLSYYYGDRSTLLYDRGNMQGAKLYTDRSREAEDARRRLLHYYNHVMSGGRWSGILNPEGFPPPRAAMMPVCTPPLWTGKKLPGQEDHESENRASREAGGVPFMEVCVWNEGEELCFVTPGEKWIEIGNVGGGEFDVRLRAPEWVELSRDRAVIRTEKRISVSVRDTVENRAGEIVIENITDGTEKKVPVRTVHLQHTDWGKVQDQNVGAVNQDQWDSMAADGSAYAGNAEKDSTGGRRGIRIPGGSGSGETVRAAEEDGLVAWEADQAESGLRPCGDFKIIPRLGRMQGCLAEARVQRDAVQMGAESGISEAIPLSYEFVTYSRGEFLLEIHRFPSLNSVGRIRIGVSLDDEPVQIVESLSNDEWKGNWRKNVLNNVDRMYLNLTVAEAGEHRLLLWAVDKYFAFSRLVIYTSPRKENSLAGIRDAQNLPSEWDMMKWCDSFYGKYELPPRPIFYGALESSEDNLTVTCRMVQAERYGEKTEPEWYRIQGNRMFQETDGRVKIDAAAALAQSQYAWTREPELTMVQKSPEGNSLWRHCACESFGRSGIALYIRTPELSWQGQDAPSLNYRFTCEGGRYILWMLSKFNVREEGVFSVGFDGAEIPGEQIYAKGSLWRYEAEQVYRWVPVTQTVLAAGEHTLHIYALASGMRYDRFYLTKGKELPPMDAEWVRG